MILVRDLGCLKRLVRIEGRDYVVEPISFAAFH